MDLNRYLETRDKKEFAKNVGISQTALYYYLRGDRLVPLTAAHKIQDITQKKVTTRDLEKMWRDKHG